jgi:acetate---CoA ligase (ADP-forming)
MSIEKFFYPHAVAVIGSTAPGKIGYELVKQIVEGGFPRVVAINPKAQGACGAPGYQALGEAPEPIELAIVAAPAPAVAGVLEECGQAGVRAAVIITAGFSEAGNRAGEDEIKRIAAGYGMRLIGPNCAGILNTSCNLYPTLETRPPAGTVALISQSGALAGAVLSWAEEQCVGFSKVVSFGNRADVDELSLLPYLAEDPETTVAALYIESVSDGRTFMQAVSDFTRRKPLVVIKSGRSQAGQRATLSHTGSLAGADAVYDAALRDCGAVRVTSVEEMFDLCRGFVSLPRPRGRRVVIVTNSGGPGVLAADRAEDVGLQVAEPSPELRAHLQGFLPAHCAFKNPIDLTVEGTETGYRRTLDAVLGEYDAALALNVAPPYLDSLPLARGIIAAADASGKPVAANFMSGHVVAEAVAYLKGHGIPNFASGERAMGVLARMAEYEEWLQAEGSAARSQGGLGGHKTWSLPTSLLEPEAMAWLRKNGIPTPEFRWASDTATAAQCSREIGYPVVMKVVAPDILHKSERGGVRLNIGDDAAAEAAFAALRGAAAGADFRGVVIYPMVRGAQEVLVGLSRDPQFGPVIVFGAGGIYTEVLRDIAVRVAPLDCDRAMAMIRSIRAYSILAGARGQAPGDLAALADLLVRVSELPFKYPEIAELDLNPVFVAPDGAFPGDVRVIRRTV